MSTINLLPDDYLQQRSQRRVDILCVVLFLVVMAGVGGAALVSERGMHQTMAVRDRVSAEYAEAARQLAQMQQLEMQKRTQSQKAQATAALLEKVPRSFLLASVIAALPEQAALTKMELKPARKVAAARPPATRKGSRSPKKGAAPKQEVHEPVLELELVGWAATDVEVARFIANLLSDPLMASVDLGYSQAFTLKGNKASGQPDMQIREFMLHLTLRGGVDAMDLMEKSPAMASEATTLTEGVEL